MVFVLAFSASTFGYILSPPNSIFRLQPDLSAINLICVINKNP
nr:MAG TPA: hypothetical protein [Caudoviricetes sp.]